MKRRDLVVLTCVALVVPRKLLAQAGARVFRVAILDDAGEKTRSSAWAAFRRRLRELGLIDGKNVVYDGRFASGQSERLGALATELVAAKPDIIICPSTLTARAALRATGTIPIAFVGPGDPVGTGLVTSLSRPGGNATGFSVTAPETAQKALEMLRELSPGLQRIAYLADTANPSAMTAYSRLEESARKQKVSIQMLDGVGATALERTYATIRRDHVQGVIVGGSGTLLDYREQITQFAAAEKLPVVYSRREYVDSGGLVSYGIDRTPLYVRVADLSYRLLRGVKPADIPVEQISAVRMVLNLKTAQALGIAIPSSLRLRADEVIE